MFTWYLCRETLKPFLLITLILMALLIAGELSDTLARVVSGQYSDWAILAIIGFQLPILAPELLPASYFLAALTTLNRLSQDSERTVLHAIGVSDTDILKKLLLYTALPATLLMLLFTHGFAPMAERNLANYLLSQQNRPLTEIVQAGEFFSLQQRDATLYARSANPADESLRNLFVVRIDDGQIVVNTAPVARIESLQQRQYLSLYDGQQTSFELDSAESDRLLYGRYALYIPYEESQFTSNRREARPTPELWRSGNTSNQSEVFKRTLPALMILVLCTWAVGLTRVKPRQAKIGAIALGIVLYIIFTFSLQTLQTAVNKGQIPVWSSPWWFVILLFLAGWYLTQRRSG